MSTTTQWTDAFLDSMRRVGDPTVDAAIAEVYNLHLEDRVRMILRDFDENSEPVPPNLPPLLTQYFQDACTLPDWADPTVLARGKAIFGRYAPHVVVTLLCSSLPMCYAAASGVQVLYRSQRLTGDIFRRIGETAQFVVDAMQEDSFTPAGRGRRSAQKIRLLHTTIRHHLSGAPDWNPAWGTPINQEDLSGTLFSFSVQVLRGLDTFGLEVSQQERDDYFHIWRVIGHLLGVDDRLNPAEYEDGAALMDTILARQWAPSVEGQAMMKALIDYMKRALPGPALDGLPASLVRELAGDQCADILAVDKANWTKLALEADSILTSAISEVTGHDKTVQILASELGMLALQGGLRIAGGGRRFQWRVPTGLTDTDET
jgi:hypothetical protein